MDALRLLVVGAPDAAARAVTVVRQEAAVSALLVPSLADLQGHAAAGGWGAVLVVPGGPLSDADVAGALAGAAAPVVVVGPVIPPALEGVATMALVWEGLEALPTLVATMSAVPAALRAVPAVPAVAPRTPPSPASTSLLADLDADPDAPVPFDAFLAHADAVLAGTADAASAPAADDPVPLSVSPPAPAYVALGDGREGPAPDPVRVDPVPVAANPTEPVATSTAVHPEPASTAGDAEPAEEPGALGVSSLAQHLPVGVYRSTPDGRVLYGNPALMALLGCDSLEALTKLDVRRDLGYPREAFLERLQREGEVRNLVVTWSDRTGRTVHTRENVRSVPGPDGQPLYFEGTMEDVTAEVEAQHAERVRARQHAAVAHFAAAADAAASPQDLYRAAVVALQSAIGAAWVMFVEHVESAASEASSRCAAWTRGFPAVAATVLNADPIFRQLAPQPETVLLRDADAEGVSWLPPSVRELMRAHGIRGLGAFPLLRAGVPLGTLVVGYDGPHTFSPSEQQAAEALAWHLAGHVSRHRAEQDLRDSEASLGFIAQHTGQVPYRLRYASGAADRPVVFDYLSPSVEALTGYDADALEAAGGLASLIEHREVLAGDGLLDGPPTDGLVCDGHYLAVYRITTRAGETRWIENNAYVWCDAGQPVGLVGVLSDVSERKALEEAAAVAAQRLSARQEALVELARRDEPDPASMMAHVADVACEAIGADEASVWLADGEVMSCRAWQARHREAPARLPLVPAASFAEVLACLREHRVLALRSRQALEAHGLAHYASAFAPQALLLAPVRRRGETVGLVLVQDREGPHDWSDGDADFAAALADTVALALERAERHRAEAALRQSEARYRALSDLTSDYAFAVALAPGQAPVLDWASGAFERMTGAGLEQLLDPAQRASLVPSESLATVTAALDEPPAAEAAESGAFEFELVGPDGTSCWLAHRTRVAETAADGTVLVYHSGQDVSERKRSEAALLAAREQAEAGRAAAEEMARLKTAFLANMSHEIRTPLTSILGFAELLREELGDEQRDLVGAIEDGGRRLLDTLNSVLDLARLEAEGLHPTPVLLSVGREVAEAARLLAPLAEAKGLTLVVDADADASASLDAGFLTRIVTNLVGNAVKFTPAGHVSVRVARSVGPDETPEVSVSVTDTGIGIPREFLPHLFDEFRQEEAGDARAHEGSGLGLAITHRLVSLMGGRISVQSQRPGGSTFTVCFPSADSPSGDPAPTPASADFQPVPDPLPTLVIPPPSFPPPAGDGEMPPMPAALAPTPEPVPAPLLDFSFRAPADAPPVTPTETSPAETIAGPFAETSFGETAPAEPSAVALGPPAFAPSPPAFAPPPLVSAPPAAFAPAPPAAEGAPGATLVTDSSAAAGPVAAAPVAAGFESVMLVRPAPPEEVKPARDPGDVRPAILVVEDNADTRMLLERILRAAYRVTAVADARSALIEMNRERFRGFVLDINLGGKETGADVLRVARSLDGYGDVFAIALTAYALPGDRDRLIEAGFDEYLSKPFTRQSLLDALAAGVRP